jgi:hypothetical protein
MLHLIAFPVLSEWCQQYPRIDLTTSTKSASSLTSGSPGTNPSRAPPTTSTIGYRTERRASALRTATTASSPTSEAPLRLYPKIRGRSSRINPSFRRKGLCAFREESWRWVLSRCFAAGSELLRGRSVQDLVDVHVLRLAHGERHQVREGVGGNGDALVEGVHVLGHVGFRDAGGQLGQSAVSARRSASQKSSSQSACAASFAPRSRSTSTPSAPPVTRTFAQRRCALSSPSVRVTEGGAPGSDTRASSRSRAANHGTGCAMWTIEARIACSIRTARPCRSPS